jgi:hypothetical protein
VTAAGQQHVSAVLLIFEQVQKKELNPVFLKAHNLAQNTISDAN